MIRCRKRLLALLSCCLLAFALNTTAQARSLVIQALFNDMAVVSIDGARITLRKGKTVRGLTLIRADSHEAVIDYQGTRKRYTLGGQPIRSAYSRADAAEPVNVWPDARGLYTATGAINGIATEMLIDTGASVVAMNSEHARTLGIDYESLRPDISVETASGQLVGSTVSLNSVRLGHIIIRDVRAVVLPGQHPRHVLLGATFLQHVDMRRKDAVIQLRPKPY